MNHDLIAIIMILLNSLLVVSFFAKFKGKIFLIFSLAFILRMLTLFWDVYGRDYFTLPHSGGDTENFLLHAMNIASNPSLFIENIYGGVYTKILSVIFFFGPESRIIPQYINILLSINSILLLFKIFKKLKVEKKIIYFSVFLYAVFPHSIIFSSILLRESLITFLLIFSIYFLVSWYKDNKSYKMFLTILLILFATSLHSGVIGTIIGVLFLYFFYDFNTKTLKFSTYVVIKFGFLVSLVLIFLNLGLENIPFLDKFTQYADDVEDVYSVASGHGTSGSSYLTNLSINSPVTFILFVPIKFVYLFSSPLPWDWRGFMDILTFLLDSAFYIIIVVFLVRNFKRIIKKNPLLLGMFLSVFTTLLIFSVGVSTAGTGIRHRHKLFFLLIILMGTVMNKNKMKKNEKNK